MIYAACSAAEGAIGASISEFSSSTKKSQDTVNVIFAGLHMEAHRTPPLPLPCYFALLRLIFIFTEEGAYQHFFMFYGRCCRRGGILNQVETREHLLVLKVVYNE